MNSVYVNVFMHVFFVFSSRSFLCPSSSSYLPSFYQFFFYCFTFLALDFFLFLVSRILIRFHCFSFISVPCLCFSLFLVVPFSPCFFFFFFFKSLFRSP